MELGSIDAVALLWLREKRREMASPIDSGGIRAFFRQGHTVLTLLKSYLCDLQGGPFVVADSTCANQRHGAKCHGTKMEIELGQN